jgi:hypothetical protein
MKKVSLLALPVFATAALLGSVTAAHATAAPNATPAAHATNISRAQAVRAAKQYLQFQAFSFKGLVGQLKYEGYSTSDATYGG